MKRAKVQKPGSSSQSQTLRTPPERQCSLSIPTPCAKPDRVLISTNHDWPVCSHRECQGARSSDLIKINSSGAVFETQLERKRLLCRTLRSASIQSPRYFTGRKLVDLEHFDGRLHVLATMNSITLCDILQYTVREPGSFHDQV